MPWARTNRFYGKSGYSCRKRVAYSIGELPFWVGKVYYSQIYVMVTTFEQPGSGLTLYSGSLTDDTMTFMDANRDKVWHGVRIEDPNRRGRPGPWFVEIWETPLIKWYPGATLR